MDSKGKRVLIADDEPDILEIIQYNLRKEGYETATARDGDDALQKAKSFSPDLIILDIMMPKKKWCGSMRDPQDATPVQGYPDRIPYCAQR